MQSFDKNNEKERYEKDTKEVDQSDLSKNWKQVNNATRFNHVALQT